MKKELIIAVMILMLLVACGSKTTGKRVAIPDTAPKLTGPTGAVAGIPTKTAEPETGKTAAEMLKEFQNPAQDTVQPAGPKIGNFYPPVTTTATGADALKAKTDALMRQAGYIPKVDAATDTGAKYHSSDGDLTNLPDKYTDSSGD
ncbi:MAG: hypothetical protein NTW67_05980 [Candidatus Woesearchaeota archaeon]|nr:hypothetical protein [Candidatus Woesearchaeota archaeon]